MNRKKIVITAAVVVVMGVLIAGAVKNKPNNDDNIGGDKTGIRVQVEKVKTDNIQTKISSSGKLEAVNSQAVYLDAGNKIIKVVKDDGDIVKKGDVILTLDKEAKLSNEKNLEALQSQLSAAQQALSNLTGTASKGDVLKAQENIAALKDSKKKAENDIENSKAEVANLKKDLEEAEKQLKLDEELLDQGLAAQNTIDAEKNSISKTNQQIKQLNDTITLSTETLKTIDLQIQSAQYDLDVLLNKEENKDKNQSIMSKQSEIKQLEKQIYDAKTSINDASTEVVAPIDGVITNMSMEDGMTVPGGTQLFTIVDPSKLKVECDISPYYAPDLKTGLEAVVKYTGSKTIEVAGKVSKVAAVASVKTANNSESTSLPVDIEVTDPGDVIKPGFSVDVKIITDTRNNVCVVPLLAVMEEDENEYYVYVVKEDGSLEKRTVNEGLSNGLNIEVEGVKEGELVVSNPTDTLTEGSKVSYEKLGDN